MGLSSLGPPDGCTYGRRVRILVATDGSERSDEAVRVVSRLGGQADTIVRLVHVVPEVLDITGVGVEELTHAAVDQAMDGMLARSRSLLGPHAPRAQRAVVRGSTTDAILEQAESFDADLIVLGHRGRGALATVLLGSTATAVAERASRPVLVVRGDLDGPVVFADDGSRAAIAARRLIATWPLFERREIRVIGVAQATAPLASGVAITMRREAAAARREELAAELAGRSLVARAAEVDLRAAGRDASVTLATGEPAKAIIDLADAVRAGLVVVGCRGHNVLAGLLGTTARAVVTGASCSVLVVHAQAAERHG